MEFSAQDGTSRRAHWQARGSPLVAKVLCGAARAAAMIFVLGHGAAAVAATAEEARAAVAAVLSDDAYQRALPGAAEPRAAPAPRSPRAVPDSPPPRLRLPPGVFQVLRVLAWVVAAVVAGLVVIALVRRLPELRRRQAAAPPPPTAPARAAEPPRDSPLAAVDELARAGRYADAMHALLLHSIAALRAGQVGPLERSLTSREIVARAALPGKARQALAEITGAVEITHFGGRPAGPAVYERCRASFDRLASSVGAAR